MVYVKLPKGDDDMTTKDRKAATTTSKPKVCSVRACKERAHAKGLCPVHYRAARTKERNAAEGVT